MKVAEMNEHPAAQSQTAERLKQACRWDPLYLFACHVEWHTEGNLRAFQDLLAALEDSSEEVRVVAESLLWPAVPTPQKRLEKQCSAELQYPPVPIISILVVLR